MWQYLTLTLIPPDLWVCSGTFGRHDGAALHWTSGYKSLAGTLDKIQLTTVNIIYN